MPASITQHAAATAVSDPSMRTSHLTTVDSTLDRESTNIEQGQCVTRVLRRKYRHKVPFVSLRESVVFCVRSSL